MTTIAILDYGFGNVLSLQTALEAAGIRAERLEEGRTLHAYDAAILPGVGKFGEAMRALESAGMFSGLWNFYEEVRKPILGIGLGMQMLCSGSQESPGQPGLNLLPGTARSMPSTLPRPYISWTRLSLGHEDALFNDLSAEIDVHVTQDYYIHPGADSRCLLASYYLGGQPAVAALRKGGVWGIQFDPTKSGEVGQQVLKNFIAITESIMDSTDLEAEV